MPYFGQIVIGPPGCGKTTYCHYIKELSFRKNGRDPKGFTQPREFFNSLWPTYPNKKHKNGLPVRGDSLHLPKW